MLSLALFLAVAALEFVSIALIVAFRDIMHSSLALASLFFMNSLLFLMMQQGLLAVVQLFVLVGGISTYMVIGVASGSFSRFRHSRPTAMAIVAAVLFALMTYPLSSMSFTNMQSNIATSAVVSGSLEAYIGIFYLMTFLLFAIALGSIVLLNAAGGKK